MDIYDAEFGWISMWLLSVISGWLTYTCARTAAKVHIQVRIIHVPDKVSIIIFLCSVQDIRYPNTRLFAIEKQYEGRASRANTQTVRCSCHSLIHRPTSTLFLG